MFSLNQLASRDYFPQLEEQHNRSSNFNPRFVIANLPANYDYHPSRLQAPRDVYIPKATENIRDLGSLMFKAHYGLLANCPPPINLAPHFAQPNYALSPCYCSHPPATPYMPQVAVCNPRPYQPYATDGHQLDNNESFLTEKEIDGILERALEGYDANKTSETRNLYDSWPNNIEYESSAGHGYLNCKCPSDTSAGKNVALAIAMAPNVALQDQNGERKKPRKQLKPQKSADFEDPNFQGVVFSMHTKLEGTERDCATSVESADMRIVCAECRGLMARQMKKSRVHHRNDIIKHVCTVPYVTGNGLSPVKKKLRIHGKQCKILNRESKSRD